MNNDELLNIILDGREYGDAYNIRINGKLHKRHNTEGITIVSKTDKDGIDIIVDSNVQNKTLSIPVVVSTSIDDVVYNDFYIGENCDVVIVAGCGVENCGQREATHNGIHTFFIGENSNVKYIEKHYGHGTGTNAISPTTVANVGKNSTFIMDTVQISGVHKSIRKTYGKLEDNSSLIVKEKIKTAGTESADSIFGMELNGKDCNLKLSSRAVATEESNQSFFSEVCGNDKCKAHVECDAILTENAQIVATPKIIAKTKEACIAHEASIGKIAEDQLTKLLSLGLDEKQAEEWIINAFLK